MGALTDRVGTEHAMYRSTVSDTNLQGQSIVVYVGYECECGWQTTNSFATSTHVAEATAEAIATAIEAALTDGDDVPIRWTNFGLETAARIARGKNA